MSATVDRTGYLLDFASSLYLGLQHSSRCLPSWRELTTGKPAALFQSPEALEVSRRFALLQGCESGWVAPSTLHLFWDLFGFFARRPLTIYVDAEIYPIALWGVERAQAQGACVHRFAHQDPDELRRLLREKVRSNCLQIVVTDGFCPDCGRIAPLSEFLAAVKSFDGYLVVDDTQALGIFGKRVSLNVPYGSGGGGLFPWHRLEDANALAVSSIAKAFGVPIAALVGSEDLVRRFMDMSDTFIHCSPTSAAVLSAARHALNINSCAGDELRRRLAQRIRTFRSRLLEFDLSCVGGLFPVQTLKVKDCVARHLHLKLQQVGLQSVLRRTHSQSTKLSFIITARHRTCDIDQAASLIMRALRSRTCANELEVNNATGISAW